MEQATMGIIITSFIIFLFIPAVFLKTTNDKRESIQKSMHLSTMALASCVETRQENYDNLSQGFERGKEVFNAKRSNIIIDEPKLLVEFNNMLFKSFYDEKKYQDIQSKIVARVLIYNDRFVIAGSEGINGYDYRTELEKYKEGKTLGFGPPYYYPYEHTDGKVYYLNTKNNILHNYDGTILYKSDGITPVTIKDIGMMTENKNDIIIKRINKVVSDYTGGLILNLKNPETKQDAFSDMRKKYFNFFDGVTFIVIYKEDKIFRGKQSTSKFNKYAVAGYTLK